MPARIHLGAQVEIDQVLPAPNGVDVQAAVLLHHRLLQHAVIDQVLNEGDGPQLTDQRRIETDLVDPLLYLGCPLGYARPGDRIQHHQQHIARRAGIDQREQAGVSQIAAVPIGAAIDLDRLECLRQAG